MTSTRHHRATRRLVPAVAVLAGLAFLAACGSSSSSGHHEASSGAGTSPIAHNAADVTFATDMIPHHTQAVEMADMALKAAVDPEIKSLAQAIKGAQQPEITTMSGWLTAWKVPAPSAEMGHAQHAGMGMMSEVDMAALAKASGPAFDTMWVAMMTRHHTSAIEMARTEIKDGRYPDAKALAQRIVSSQSVEVKQMIAIAKRLS